MGAMDFWPHMCKNRMNCPAGDVVTPSLVEVAKWLEEASSLSYCLFDPVHWCWMAGQRPTFATVLTAKFPTSCPIAVVAQACRFGIQAWYLST
jgi:hypothetical protein